MHFKLANSDNVRDSRAIRVIGDTDDTNESMVGVTSGGDMKDIDAVTLYASLLRGELDDDVALHATHRMLELVMNSIPQAVFWKDVSSRYLGCNQVFADLAGLEPDELLGKSDLEMPWAAYDEAPEFLDWDQVVISSGEPKFGIVEHIHLRDGTMLRIETNKVPLLDFDGNVVGILGTFEDVSDRLRAEEDLRQSFEELDERVRLRTAELSRANEILRHEVDERVRLQAEERQQRAYADALRETAAAISRSLDLDDVIEEALVGVERLMSHDLGVAVLIDADDGPYLAQYRARFGYGNSTGESENTSPLDIDLGLIGDLDDPTAPALHADVVSEGRRGLCPDAGSVMVAPMSVGGQLIGYLVAESSTRGFFSDGHSRRLQTVADQAAAAISNARLYARAAELAAVDERQRLARDLHDSVSQSLWSASLLSGSLAASYQGDSEMRKQVDTIGVLTKGALAEMRTLLLELRPSALEEASLEELLAQLVAAFESRKAATVNWQMGGVDALPISEKLALYRIAQEALNNIARHADATQVSLEVAVRSRSIELTITDNGNGYVPEDVQPDRMGIAIMAERAENVGGRLNIQSTPGSGSTVRASVPVRSSWWLTSPQ